MDPISVTIVSALAAGAAAAAKDVATDAIKDAYAGLKRLIVDRYGKTTEAVDLVTKEPASKARQAVLAEELEKTDAAENEELKAAAQALLDAVAELSRTKPEAAALFDVDQLQLARDAKFKDIHAAQVLRVRGKAEIGRDLTAEGIVQMPGGGGAEKK